QTACRSARPAPTLRETARSWWHPAPGLELQIEKAHERYAVADQVLSPIVREIVERLQHHDLELQDRVIGLAAGVALALLGLRLRHGLDVSTEILPWHDLLDRFQRIAQSADRLQPALNIEKALLPHNPPAPSAHDRARSSSQIRGDLARGISRGALKPSPLSRASQARPKAQLPRAGASSRELHVFEITRLVVDADTRRRDPACELAGFDHLTHQALYEVAVILRRQPLVLLLVPPCRVDQLPARRRRDVLELADLPVERHVRQLESEAHADPLD